MIARLFIALCLAPLPAQAANLVSDAFGIFDDTHARAEERLRWSGEQTMSGDAARSVAPGTPSRVLNVFGPKSLVAGKDEGHVVGLVLDAHGNLVADGTQAIVAVDAIRVDRRTVAGIADYLFLPDPVAHEMLAGISSGEAQSARAMARVVPDIASARPEAPPTVSRIRDERFFEIGTGTLVDRFGNEVDDGTAILTIMQLSDGAHALATSIAIGGEAKARFLARDIAGPAEIGATLGSTVLPASRVEIVRPRAVPATAMEVLPVESIAAVQIVAGPFRTEDGFTLADGAAIRVEIVRTDGTRHAETGWARDGFFSALVPVGSLAEIESATAETPLGSAVLTVRGAPGTLMETLE